MPTYLVTGISRGLGFEFAKQLSEDPKNVVIGLVRDKAATGEKLAKELGGRTNIHVVQADMSSYESLKDSVPLVEKASGGALDYIIANAGLLPSLTSLRTFGSLGNSPIELEQDLVRLFQVNAVANVHLFNLYLPMILKGSAKKVIAISSGHADTDLVPKYDLAVAGSYSVSKAALNMIIAKFSAEFRKDGVLFMSVSPGVADTGNHQGNISKEEQDNMQDMFVKFSTYAPHFTGPSTPEQAVKDVLAVVERASLSRGDAGAIVSQFGNKQWL